jgi:hypothetical protein
MAFHKLRAAARHDPIAAYNLGNYLLESAEMATGRRRRAGLALRMFEEAAVMGMERLRNPSEPSSKAPKAELELRDIISRALTNIGGHVSNTGFPERAVDHFKRSIAIFHDNANAHVCLGNMGVFHSDRTGIDPLDGIASWHKAARIGDFCHESDIGCPCRENTVRIARQVERDYGKEEAREWVSKRYAIGAGRKSAKDFAPIAAKATDVGRLTGSPHALLVAEVFGEIFSDKGALPLEMKVTLAACFAGALARLDTPYEQGDPSILDRAVEAAYPTEPLHPFIGDDEWQDLGPPETLYLTTQETSTALMEIVTGVIGGIRGGIQGLSPDNAVLGVLFHLDRDFRRGVTSMVRDMVLKSRLPYGYVPGTVIGSPARQ